MTITKVEYRRLESFGDFQNHTIGAVADVDVDEDPDEVLAELKAWIDDKFKEDAESRRDHYRKVDAARDLENEIRRYEDALAELKAKWDKAKAFLEHHGIDTNRYNPELPF